MIKTDYLLTPILKNLGIEEGVRLVSIKNNWHYIFEKPLSLHMSPSRLSEGKLLINVDSPIWLQQLSYYKREITKKLDAYGVKDVHFRIGKLFHKKQFVSKRQKTAELSSEDTLFVSELISQISDDTIKEAVKRALEKSLSSKKKGNVSR